MSSNEKVKIKILESEELDRLTSLEDWLSEFEESEVLEMLNRYQEAQFNSKKYRQSEKGKATAQLVRERQKIKVKKMEERLAELEALQAISKADVEADKR